MDRWRYSEHPGRTTAEESIEPVGATEGYPSDGEELVSANEVHGLITSSDLLQSAASRMAAYLAGKESVPYEVRMAALEAQGAVAAWTRERTGGYAGEMDREEVDRETIALRVLETLPEFCSRNGIELDAQRMSNLAHWAVNAFPPRVYRNGCGAGYTGPPIACACPGTCQHWFRVP